MKKKSIAVVALSTLVFANLVGCGNQKDNNDSDTSTPTATVEATKEADTADIEETDTPLADATQDPTTDSTETSTPSSTDKPVVYDENGKEKEVVNTSPMPDLSTYDYITNGKVWVNTLGEIQVDYDDGTQEILWSPYILPIDDKLSQDEVYKMYAEVPSFSAEDKTIAVIDENGSVIEYVGSDSEGFAQAYKVAFDYCYYALEKPDEEYTKKTFSLLNELSDESTKYTDDEMKEYFLNIKNAPTEELVSFNISDVCTNKDRTEYGIVFYESYNTTEEESTQTVAKGYVIKKIDNKWYFTHNCSQYLGNYINECMSKIPTL